MRILLLSDLHSRLSWLQWVAAQTADLTAISGDLLDGFHPAGLLPQMIAFKIWTDAFPNLLALSSGNHDGNIEGGRISSELSPLINREAALDLLIHEHWMDALERPGIVTDRRSQLLVTSCGEIVVTTIPFYPGQQGPRFCDDLWEAGRRLRQASRALWLVLCHEPPADTLVGGHAGDPSLFYKIRECQPDFVLSGHIHGQPYVGSFADQLGKTWCFNPGVPPARKMRFVNAPNHIFLDTEALTATWHATCVTGKSAIHRTATIK